MSPHDWDDRLVDTFLAEAAGAAKRPALRSGIKDKLHRRARRRAVRLIVLAGTAAALLLLYIGLAALRVPPPQASRPAYPAPVIVGAHTVAGGSALQRGATIETEDEPALMRLGGYADVELAAGTQVTLAGQPRDERVVLHRGVVTCDIPPTAQQPFEVATEVGTVSVVGTQFTVALQNEENEMTRRKMVVRVMAGLVLATALDGSTTLVRAGEKKEIKPPREERKRGDRNVNLMLREGRDFVRRILGDDYERLAGPRGEELRAIRLQEEEAEARMKALRAEAMEGEAVLSAGATAKTAAEAFYKALDAHPDYKALIEKKDALEKQQGDLGFGRGGMGQFMRQRGKRDWQAMREKWQELRQLREDMETVEQEMRTLVEQTPALKTLADAKQKAAAAYVEAVEAAVAAHPDYKNVSDALAFLQRWKDDVFEAMQAEQKEMIREEREKRRKKEEEAEKRGEKPPAEGEAGVF